MAKKIGIRLYLDGATQFNSDVKKINDNLKLLGSEMKQNQEIFKTSQNSAEALSAKSQILNKQYEEAEKKVKAYSTRMEELRKAREADEKNLENYNKQLQQEQQKLAEIEKTQGKNSEAYAQQAAKVAELEQSIQKTTTSIEQLDSKEVQLQTSLNNATTEQIKYGSELVQTNAYLKEAENSTDNCAKSIDKYGKEVDDTDKSLDKMADTLDNLAKNEAMEKLGEGAKKVLEGLMECVETAEEFEYSIAKVQSIARVSKEDLANMSSEIRRVGADMGYSATEVSEAAYQAISASVDASEAVGFVEDATKLARAGFTDTVTAVDVLTTSINAYGKEANTTKHIADDLITTQNLGKTTVNELAQSLGTVIPTASALNVSLDQLSSAYVIMTKQGINTANATTYIRAMMNELSDSGSDVSKTLSDLTGHTFGELMQQGWTLGDVMQTLGDSVEGNGESFKNLFGNIRAGLGALSLFNQGADAFDDAMKAMQENAGATDEAFAIMADTAVMTNERFKASVENLKIAIGESLSPTLDEFKKKGIDVLNFFTELAEENPQLVQALAGATAGIAAMTVAVTAAAAAMALLRLAFGDVSAAGVLVAAGVAGAAGAIGAVALASNDAAKEIGRANDALQKTHQTNKDIASANRESNERAKELADTYNELAGKAHLTDEEFEQLNSVITELNTTVPGCSIAYRDNKDAINENTDAVHSYVEALIEEIEYESKVEELSALYKEQAEAKKVAAEASDALAEETQKLTDLERDLAMGVTDSGQNVGTLERNVRDLTEAQKEAQDVVDENETRIKELSDSIENYVKKTQEATKTNEELKDALGITHDSLASVKEANEAIKDAAEEANDKVREQIGLFDEWNKKSDLTLESMQKRWKDQTTGVNQYKDDLVYLKQVIDSDTDPAIRDLAQNMANMGVDGAAEIHNFVEGLKKVSGNKDKVTELAKTWQEHNKAISEATGIYEAIKLEEQGYTKQSQKLFNEYYSSREKDKKDFNGQITLLSEQGVKDSAQAIEQNSKEVENATKQMFDNSFSAACEGIGMPKGGGQSSDFYQVGKSITSSIAKGIEDESGSVSDAIKKTMESATNNIDVSGLAERINRKLGEAMERAESR